MPGIVGVIAFVLLLFLIGLRIPIGFAMLFVGLLGITYLAGLASAMSTLVMTVWTTVTGYILMAIPLFLVMGQFIKYSDIGSDLYESALKWLGKVKGGLALGTIFGMGATAACTGSVSTGILTLGPVAYGPMKKLNYSKPLILGSICAGSTLGGIIPPSIIFVVYGSITNESVGKLFIAGILPGILEIFSLLGKALTNWSRGSSPSPTIPYSMPKYFKMAAGEMVKAPPPAMMGGLGAFSLIMSTIRLTSGRK